MAATTPQLTPPEQRPVGSLRGVGPALAEKLAKLGVTQVQDLLFVLPMRYEDRTQVTPIGSVRHGARYVVEGEIQLTEVAYRRRRQLLCRITDGSGSLTLRFFYFSAAQQAGLKRGTRIRCFGEVRRGPLGLEIVHPEYRYIESAGAGAGAEAEPLEEVLTPIYPTTEGVPQTRLRALIEQALRSIVDGADPGAKHAGVRDCAAEFGASAHEGQKRLSGEPYIAHPLAAAQILADLHLDPDTIIAAILHDVIEDTPISKEELSSKFGAPVAEIVDGVTKLDQIQFKSRAEAQAESFRKMVLAMVRDLRVILVKLADRTHNMRTLDAMAPARRRAVARETLDIYAPIAGRLGLYNMKLELEDLGFKAAYPHRYRVLDRALKKARGNQKQFLTKIADTMRVALAKSDLKAEVSTREKHLYSIYSKMLRKGAPLSEIVDVFGLRVVVDRADSCYRALGVVHAAYKPMPGRFKDYIAIPRVNGYQSLHTTLFGPNGIPIEVQIRTEDMHRVAEAGIAAHWKYKVSESESGQDERAREWLANLVDMQESGSSEDFLESVKVDLFPDKVYVFTPKGEILRLPRGATVVDFAYAVHTDVGNRCVAAKVDRRLTPLRTPLRNGQTVEIITAKGAMPNPSWVNFVVTAKARAAVRHYLKGLRRQEAIELGARLINQALGEFRMSLDEVSADTLNAAVVELGMHDSDELYEKVGLGERLAPLVARRLLPTKASEESFSGAPAPLAIAGTEGLLVAYARCCFPIPDDPIFAFLSAGRGVVVHRENCVNVEDYRKHPENWLPVAWEATTDKVFSSEIRVDVANKMGVLAAVAAAISSGDTNIERVAVEEKDADSSSLVFELRVRNREHLARVVKTIRRMPEVLKVTRTIASHGRASRETE